MTAQSGDSQRPNRARWLCWLAAALLALPPAAAAQETPSSAPASPTQDAADDAPSADDIQGLIDDIEGRIGTIGQSNLDSDAALELLSDKVEEAISKLTSREAENLSLRGTTSGLQTELETLEEVQESLQSDIEQLREESASTVSKLETQVATLVDELALEEQNSTELAQQIGRLNAELADTLAARDAARTARDAALAERDEAENLISEQLVTLNDLRAQTEALRREKQALESQVARLDSLVDDGKARLSDEQRQVAALQTALDASQVDLADERGRAIDLSESLRDSRAELLEERNRSLQLSRTLDETLDGLAASQTAAAAVEDKLAGATAQVERQEVQLANLRSDLAASTVALTAEQDVSAQAKERVSLLNQQLEELKRQLLALNNVLDAAEARNDQQQAQIVDLGSRLNQALATRVQELASYRSEFFGRLREVLGERPDVRVVGDRFVFQSEVLFESGEAELGEDGKAQLFSLAKTLEEIGDTIPDDLDWVLRVDGHTDERPISTAQFPSNWELSTARALSVVKFMIDSGIDPDRLVAAGFGRYHPLDPRRDEIGFRRNRRIEFKLTQR